MDASFRNLNPFSHFFFYEEKKNQFDIFFYTFSGSASTTVWGGGYRVKCFTKKSAVNFWSKYPLKKSCEDTMTIN